METELLRKLGSREITKVQLFHIIESNFGLVPDLIKGTDSPKATVRYGCGKVLMDLSEKYPDNLYPYIDSFIKLLDSKHRILTWNAMAIIADLTKVDADCKFDAIFDKYYGYLGNEYMVTVSNVVVNSAKIASNKTYLADRIATKLLKVQDLKLSPHLTEECCLVIAEQAIKTFSTIANYTQNKKALVDFARKHQNSSRISLRKVANFFLKKWQ